MASPQCENGYTKIANEIMEALMQYNNLPKEQMRVVLCILRASYGWNEKAANISHQEIADQTGISRPGVTRAITHLVSNKVLKCTKQDTLRCNCLEFNKNYNEWVSRKKRKFGTKQDTKNGTLLGTHNAVVPITRKKRNKGEKRKPQKKAFRTPSGHDLLPSEPWLNIKAWDEWIKYRADIKKPYKTEIGITKALNVLRPFDKKTQQQMIDRSISAEYQGLFPPKETKNGDNKPEKFGVSGGLL